MIVLTDSMRKFLVTFYPDKLSPILFGHAEEFTEDMAEEYVKWLKESGADMRGDSDE